MKTIVAILVVIVVLAGGAYALVKHNDNKNKTSSSSSSGYNYNTPASSTSSNQTPAVNNAVLITKTSSGVGSYLAEPDGTTLYTYSQDSNGVSNCTGSCLSAWPPYEDSGATTGLPTNVSTIKRSDNGKTQFTYKGKPLYTFVSDSKNQVTGNGVSGFAVAKP